MKKIFLFLFFVSSTCSAESLVCQNLFGDIDLEKSVHALAELRFQLDSAKANNTLSIALSPLENEYKKKEKALMNFFTKNNYMSKNAFLTLIKREIEEIQKNSNQPNIKIDENPKALKDILFVENRAVFQIFDSHKADLKKYAVMNTLVTQIFWKKIAELINTKLDKNYEDLETEPSNEKGNLLPVTNVSYDYIAKWLNGLNTLSQRGEPELKFIINGHEDGFVYQLPSDKHWQAFVGAFSGQIFLNHEVESLYSKINDDVTAHTPIKIENDNYFGLFGDYKNMLETFDSKYVNISFLRQQPFFYHHNKLLYDSTTIPRTEYQNSMVFRLIRLLP